MCFVRTVSPIDLLSRVFFGALPASASAPAMPLIIKNYFQPAEETYFLEYPVKADGKWSMFLLEIIAGGNIRCAEGDFAGQGFQVGFPGSEDL